eukprot:TRINITY_DN8967_c0_g2_i2.p1 TRINITY_DN8967_c0_g2~~TRINITY_DN8967_c0_g2_i2.p1  ORF type:complete len:371 (-),score=67.96 TRINITY_DN8967_c0_g2_i2:578-1633(-)
MQRLWTTTLRSHSSYYDKALQDFALNSSTTRNVGFFAVAFRSSSSFSSASASSLSSSSSSSSSSSEGSKPSAFVSSVRKDQLTADTKVECVNKDVQWIANHIVSDLPSWYRNRLSILSIGAGDGGLDFSLSAALVEQGCKIEKYMLVDSEETPASSRFDSKIRANHINRHVIPMQNLRLQQTPTVVVFFNSLHHVGDSNVLNVTTFGAYGAPLTFVSGNARMAFYTDPVMGYMARIKQSLEKMAQGKIEFTSEVLSNVIDFTGWTPSQVDEVMKLYSMVAEDPKDVEYVKTQIRAQQMRRDREAAETQSRVVVDASKLWQSYVAKISRLQRDPQMDPILAWKKLNYGPGYD